MPPVITNRDPEKALNGPQAPFRRVQVCTSHEIWRLRRAQMQQFGPDPTDVLLSSAYLRWSWDGPHHQHLSPLSVHADVICERAQKTLSAVTTTAAAHLRSRDTSS